MRTLRCLVLCLGAVAASATAAAPHYRLAYHARFEPDEQRAAVRLAVEQGDGQLKVVDFDAPDARYRDFAGDGDIDRDGDRVVWQVPAKGGELRYTTSVDHKRSDTYDARMTDCWAIVRLDDLFPPARTRSKHGARSRARLYLSGPRDWSFETPYGRVGDDGVAVATRGRRFDRPVGWLAAGDLGVRRTRIDGREFVIAGPKGEAFRRMDLLVFLRWTVPELVRVAPSLPKLVLIVGGSSEMWRGGLSGPGSLYVHPDRPLVSGNSTSTYLHELIHVATLEPPAAGDDWIVEGIAEYYSLTILLRTGAISGERFGRTMDSLGQWAKDDDGELTSPSTGADTARAVLLFRDLDLELGGAGHRLDEVAAELLPGVISRERLASLVEDALGKPSRVLRDADVTTRDD